jgi:hypothetical protein
MPATAMVREWPVLQLGPKHWPWYHRRRRNLRRRWEGDDEPLISFMGSRIARPRKQRRCRRPAIRVGRAGVPSVSQVGVVMRARRHRYPSGCGNMYRVPTLRSSWNDNEGPRIPWPPIVVSPDGPVRPNQDHFKVGRPASRGFLLDHVEAQAELRRAVKLQHERFDTAAWVAQTRRDVGMHNSGIAIERATRTGRCPDDGASRSGIRREYQTARDCQNG